MVGSDRDLVTESYDYHLPPELIAHRPLQARDCSRLLVIDQNTDQLIHASFRDLAEFLSPGDLLVINDTKVLKARIVGNKQGSGGRVEILLVKPLRDNRWEALVKPGRRVGAGASIVIDGEPVCQVVDVTRSGRRVIEFIQDPDDIMDRYGQIPLPPYINEPLASEDQYQTVFADHKGSAAAPTAGLHFTTGLFDQIKSKGINTTTITLHIGPDTFVPVRSETLTDHQMHSEFIQVPVHTVDKIKRAKNNGHRVIGVGTTVVRALESAAATKHGLQPYSGYTDLFIYPGYQFDVIDAMITNFHLPKSTLLALCSAFCGRQRLLDAYREAIEKRYRFYSFGDAMLIL